MQPGHSDRAKIEKYVGLIDNYGALKRASQSLIRRKHSPLALKLASGDGKAMLAAAKARVLSAIAKARRPQFCRALCEFKHKIEQLRPTRTELRRHIIVWLLESGLSFFDHLSAIAVALIWVLRHEILERLCVCGLQGKCHELKCA